MALLVAVIFVEILKDVLPTRAESRRGKRGFTLARDGEINCIHMYKVRGDFSTNTLR